MIRGTKAEEKAEFRAFIDQAVLAATTAGTITFRALLCHLPSVYPTELLASLGRLAESGAIDPALAASVRREASTHTADPPDGRSLLPLPHPLDFEWRFTADAARNLLNVTSALTGAHANVLLFGTPGLAAEALSLPTNRRLSFLGEDNAVTCRLIALNSATGFKLSIAFCSAGLPHDSADAVVLDPPWYIDFMCPMLSAASAACRRDGIVLVSLPPAGTRPSAQADRETVIRFAVRLGLDLLEERPLALPYDTPFFEANALAAAGIVAPSQWRRGDLAVFRKSRRSTRPAGVASGRCRTWIEISVRRMRLFIKPDPKPAKGLEGLLPLVDGDILPSVSRRDPRRRGAQVWTSGNRVFRTDNANLVIEAALAHRNEETGAGVQPRLWGNLRERDAVQRVGYMLEELAAREAVEEGGALSVGPERSMPWTSSSTNSYGRLMATAFG